MNRLDFGDLAGVRSICCSPLLESRVQAYLDAQRVEHVEVMASEFVPDDQLLLFREDPLRKFTPPALPIGSNPARHDRNL